MVIHEQRDQRDEQQRRPPAAGLEADQVGVDETERRRQRGDDECETQGERQRCGMLVVHLIVVDEREIGLELEQQHAPEADDEEIDQRQHEQDAEDGQRGRQQKIGGAALPHASARWFP
jgi:hypothetical protein